MFEVDAGREIVDTMIDIEGQIILAKLRQLILDSFLEKRRVILLDSLVDQLLPSYWITYARRN